MWTYPYTKRSSRRMTVGDVILMTLSQWQLMTVIATAIWPGGDLALSVGDGNDLPTVVVAAFFADAVGEASFATGGAAGHLYALISVCRFADTHCAFADFALLNSHDP